MKNYLVTLLGNQELENISLLYSGWTDIDNEAKNLEAFSKFSKSGVDSICIFGRILKKNGGEFGDIIGPDIFVTEEGMYYYEPVSDSFKVFEAGSNVYFLRIKDMDYEYLIFLKKFGKEKWGINFYFSYDFDSNYIHSKQFGMYTGYISGTAGNIPKSVIPLIHNESEPSVFYRFLEQYKNIGKKVILKTIGGSGGEGIFIFDFDSIGFKNNFQGTISILIEGGYKKMVCMELIDTLDYEIRLLWVKRKETVKIVKMFKKVRIKGEILHNISQGNSLENISDEDVPNGLEEKVKSFCGALSDRHGGLDIIIGKDGKYYFTENNTLTGYLDTEAEIPYLSEWLEEISKVYEN